MPTKRTFAIHARWPPKSSASRSSRASPLGTISVAIDLQRPFLDLWREAERRFKRAYGADSLLGLYFSTLCSASRAPFMMDDKIADYFQSDCSPQDFQLVFQLQDIRSPEALPANSPLRPPNFRLPRWDDLTVAEQKKVEKCRAEEQIMEDIDMNITGEVQQSESAARIDVQGFKIPPKPSRTPPRNDATLSQASQGTILAINSQPESARTFRSHSQTFTHAEASPSKRRRVMSAAIRTGSRHPQGPPTPDSLQGLASSQMTPPSAQRPLNSQAPLPRPVWQSVNKSTAPLESDTVDPIDEFEEYGADDHHEDYHLNNTHRPSSQAPSTAPSTQTHSSSTSETSAFDLMSSSQGRAKNQAAILRGAASDWSPEEDELLLKGVRLGWNSTQIFKAFPPSTRRTQSSIRNRKATLRKRNQLDQPSPELDERSQAGSSKKKRNSCPLQTQANSEVREESTLLPEAFTGSMDSALRARNEVNFTTPPKVPNESKNATPGAQSNDDAEELLHAESDVPVTLFARRRNEEEQDSTGNSDRQPAPSPPRVEDPPSQTSNSENGKSVDTQDFPSYDSSTSTTPDPNNTHRDVQSNRQFPTSSAGSNKPGKLKRPTHGGTQSRIVLMARENPQADRYDCVGEARPESRPPTTPEERIREHKRLDNRMVGAVVRRDEDDINATKHHRRALKADQRIEDGREPRKVKDPLRGLVHMPVPRDETPVDGEIDRNHDYSTDSDDKSFVSMPPDDDSYLHKLSDEDNLSMMTTRTVEEIEDDGEHEAMREVQRVPEIVEEPGPSVLSHPSYGPPQVTLNHHVRTPSSGSDLIPSDIPASESSCVTRGARSTRQYPRRRKRGGRIPPNQRRSVSEQKLAMNVAGTMDSRSTARAKRRKSISAQRPAVFHPAINGVNNGRNGNSLQDRSAAFSYMLPRAHIPTPPRHGHIVRHANRKPLFQIFGSDESESDDDSC